MQAFFTDRRDRGRLRVTGRDRQAFLQGMVSNDVAKLMPGQGCYTFILDATGHVLSDAHVRCFADYLLLDVEPGQADFVKTTLEKYLIMERCRITDVSSELRQYTVWGPDAARALNNAFGVDLSASEAEGDNVTATSHGDEVQVATTRLLSVPCFDVYFPQPNNTDVVYSAALQTEGVVEADAATLDAYRIEAGIPRFGVDMDARVLAPETDQAGRAISYKKGCYIGQEIVARIDARGHTNRTFVGFYLDDGPLPTRDTPLSLDGREVGRITSSVVGPTLGLPVALGYLRREHAEPGMRLTFGDGRTTQVSALPFPGTVGR